MPQRLSDYQKKENGEKIYRLSLSSGCTCPNRDGSIILPDGTPLTGGCTFCSEGGSGEFAAEVAPVDVQIEEAKKRIRSKTDAKRFIAYFQSYTNTYGDLNRLRALYKETIERDDVVILAIGTRPDCIGEDVLSMLKELRAIKPVWIELGLQTSNENTAKYIRRGYENECYKQAVGRLRDIGIYVITHVILYLPGESVEDMENTLRFVTACGSDGIKLSLLHVLRDTDLEKEYEQGKVILPDMEEYLDTLTDLLELLPPDMAIHRMTGDGPKSILIAPLWTGDKKKVLNRLKRVMEEKDTTQGRRWKLEQN